MIQVNLDGIEKFTDRAKLPLAEAKKSLESLPGGEWAGWLDLPKNYGGKLRDDIKAAAEEICDNAEALVVIGIGGSYLGARAIIDALKSPFYNSLPKKTPDVYFAGNNVSGEYIEQIIALIGNRDFAINIVSKSGSTIETAIANRIFCALLEAKYGKEEAAKRVYVTTGGEKSPLRKIAVERGYKTFAIPEDVGGRFSVFTAVGLLPAAVAGVDIDALMAGAKEAADNDRDAAISYAAVRQTFYRAGKKTEVLGNFEPALQYIGEWWKQLFGESEGKKNIGIFPASVNYTTDLHSMGQYIQEGERSLFETLVVSAKSRSKLRVPASAFGNDGIDAITAIEIAEVNAAAAKGVKQAHIDGGVPVIELGVPEISDESIGELLYFFELSCAISATMSGIDPFNQPGVEAYKINMKKILGIIK